MNLTAESIGRYEWGAVANSAVGIETPFGKGVHTPLERVFSCFLMVGRTGLPSGRPSPLHGSLNPVRSIARRLRPLAMGLFYRKGANLMATLSFNTTELSIIDHKGQQWLSGPDMARALGYERSDAVARIYARFKTEFDDTMSTNVKLTGVRDIQRNVRIYSRRGAHLIAILSRTPKAARFRKWVLDVLEEKQAPIRLPENYHHEPSFEKGYEVGQMRMYAGDALEVLNRNMFTRPRDWSEAEIAALGDAVDHIKGVREIYG